MKPSKYSLRTKIMDDFDQNQNFIMKFFNQLQMTIFEINAAQSYCNLLNIKTYILRKFVKKLF